MEKFENKIMEKIENTIMEEREYNSVCWRCKTKISSYTDVRCPRCGWYFCPHCGACAPDCADYDDFGYNALGYNRRGYDRDGYNMRGFDKNGIHKNGTPYDDDGVDVKGRFEHQKENEYLNKRIDYKKLYGKGTITSCYYKDKYVRVRIEFDNGKTIEDVAIKPALEKEIVVFI